MWIKTLPEDYSHRTSFCFNNVFLWREGTVFVMDNHMGALWGWLQSCNPRRSYNFMHIDMHYDLLDCFYEEDLVVIKENPKLPFDDLICLKKHDGQCNVLRWDNYIMAGYVLFPDWFHTNVFLTQKEGNIKGIWGNKHMSIREENPLCLDDYIQQYVGEPSKFLDGFSGDDYRLPWIVNLDLDIFYTVYSKIQLFSDDYIRIVAASLQRNIKNIAALTIAISPDCLGGKEMDDKWANGFRILKIMSEQLECLKGFFDECSDIII